MAQPVRDSFLDLEKHRRLLEENIAKLRKSLQHWQTLDAEYEGLKEEILAAKPEPNFQRLISIGREFGGSLLNQDEIDEVLGVKSGKLRSASQVTDLLSKRIDYTQQNVKTLEKQLLAAENKLAAAIVISTPDALNEDGLPLTEIFEELDDNGNVISSRLSTPGSSKAQLLEVLEKAGVKDLKDGTSEVLKQETAKDEAPAELKVQPVVNKIEQETPKPKTPKKGVTFSNDIQITTFKRDSRPNSKERESEKKTVNFPDGALEDKKPISENQSSISEKEIKKLTELIKEQNEPLPVDVIVPENESEEDAALRQEMLKYGMSDLGEVGAIVAEINLEEDDTGLTDDDEYDDFDDEDEDDDDSGLEDDEDAFGRSTGRIVSDKVHRQMRELEKRLNARMMQNVGPTGDINGVHEGVASIAIKPDVEDSDAKKTNGGKKGVRFAEKLDISPPPSESTVPQPNSKPVVPAKSPVGDIVERVPALVAEPKITAPIKKLSKFKSARGSQSSTEIPSSNPMISTPPKFPTFPKQPQPPLSTRTRITPTGPQNSIISDIIEHEPSKDQVTEPDELDADLLHREAATRYHEMTNRMIQRQGGFLQEEEETEVDEDGFVRIPMDEDDGGKKISRFMAARVARS